MPKRIVLCFDGTWNTPAEKFSGLAQLHERFARLLGLGNAEMQAEIEHVDPNAGVETNVCRLYRSVLRLEGDAISQGELAQTKWYDKGVGTDWYDRVSGGAFGLGTNIYPAPTRTVMRFSPSASAVGRTLLVASWE